MLKTGDKAPDFTTTDHQGKTVSLAQLHGKIVVLWFFPKADTPGCTAEGCSFRDLQAEYQKKGAVILGASFDNAADNKAFAQKFHFTFPLLCDTDRKLGLAYGACSEASAKVANRIGIVIDAQGKIAQFNPKVEAQSWPAELLKSL